MRKNLFMKKSLVFLLLFPLVLFLFCGGERTTRPTKPKYKFTINGVVVKDLSLDKDIAYFTILRDSTPFDSALVKVDQDTIKSQSGGSGIYSEEASHLFDFGDTLTIMVASAEDTFAVDFDVIIPGFFRITDITGISGREVHSGESPQILFKRLRLLYKCGPKG
jgi:preprotein translocase subunit SecB